MSTNPINAPGCHSVFPFPGVSCASLSLSLSIPPCGRGTFYSPSFLIAVTCFKPHTCNLQFHQFCVYPPQPLQPLIARLLFHRLWLDYVTDSFNWVFKLFSLVCFWLIINFVSLYLRTIACLPATQ